MFRKFLINLFILIYCSTIAQAQISDQNDPDLDPDNYDVDNMYFHVGVYFGLSQAVAIDLKHIAISGVMEHDIAKIYEPVFKTAIERRGLKQYLEVDFLVTDLFPEAYTENKSTFIVYKQDSILEQYLALKERKQELIDNNNYDQAARREVATGFGKLLSYTDETIEENLKKNGFQ